MGTNGNEIEPADDEKVWVPTTTLHGELEGKEGL